MLSPSSLNLKDEMNRSEPGKGQRQQGPCIDSCVRTWGGKAHHILEEQSGQWD